MTNFHDVQSLLNYLDGLFHFKECYVNSMGKAKDAGSVEQ